MARSDLTAFIQSQILTTQRSPTRSAPPLARCLQVKAVAPVSPAAHAGVAVGDLLTSINGQSAGTLDPNLYRKPARQRTYIFYSARAGQRTELVASGIDLGLQLAPTPQAISAGYKPDLGDPAPLLALWEARAWPELEKLSGEVLRRITLQGTPALLLHGAALFEQARVDQGFEQVLEYVKKYVSHWTQDYSAIAAYYAAMKTRMNGETGAAVALLQDAFQKAPFERFAEALVSLGEEKPRPPIFWLDRRFPQEYALQTIEGTSRTVALSEALAGLSPGGVFLVCLLDGYRANGPYNDFMRRFFEFATYFKPFLAGLHVITEERERRPDRAYWFECEDKARAAQLPFEVLLDGDGTLSQAMRPPGSPYVVALDGQGTVLAEREMEAIDLWSALAKASAS